MENTSQEEHNVKPSELLQQATNKRLPSATYSSVSKNRISAVIADRAKLFESPSDVTKKPSVSVGSAQKQLADSKVEKDVGKQNKGVFNAGSDNTNQLEADLKRHRKANRLPSHIVKERVASNQVAIPTSPVLSNDLTNVKNAMGTTIKNSPPTKPPRTFVHDDYMRQKDLQRKLALSDRTDENGNNGVYEEVPRTDGKQEHNEKNRQHVASKGHIYEEIPEHASKGKTLFKDEVSQVRPMVPPKPPANRVQDQTKQTRKVTRENTPVKVTQPHTYFKNNDIVVKAGILNPSYGKANDVIPIKTIVHNGTLKHYKSDECLYWDGNSNGKKPRTRSSDYLDELPVYQEPTHNLEKSRISEPVVQLDSEGYAIPGPSKLIIGQSNNSRGVTRGESQLVKGNRSRKLRNSSGFDPVVRQKLSVAYSVLRQRKSLLSDSDDTTDGNDSDAEIDSDDQLRRLEYLCRSRYNDYKSVYEPAMFRQRSVRVGNIPLLFSAAYLVNLERDSVQGYRPQVVYSFPHQDNPVVGEFCFPDANNLTLSGSEETYMFILTSSLGEHQYGYCLRFGPNDGSLPEVYCVVSEVYDGKFYHDMLKLILTERKKSKDDAEVFIQKAYGTLLPKPGAEAWIKVAKKGDKHGTKFLRRSTDTRFDQVRYCWLLECFSIDHLIKVFACLLLERKVVFLSDSLGTLSKCTEAVLNLLYPLVWNHTLIPILPPTMLEVCEAPSPFIVGVLRSNKTNVLNMENEAMLVLDLDKAAILRSEGDERKILPKRLQKALRTAIKDECTNCKLHNELVGETFLRLFVETIGHYTDFVTTQQNGERVFQKLPFIKAVHSKSIQLFLEWFTETQMFEHFIRNRLENVDEQNGLFEKRVEEYREEMEAGNNLRKNFKGAGRRMLNFFVESGGRLKRALFKQNVFV